MYLCIIDTNQHHDGTTTYPPHTLGSLRFRNGGAGTTGLYPRHLGFRTIREIGRPREPYVHGREPRQYAVVILDVVTTCGCTVPQFTKRPIRPGEKTTVKVTIDPANRPGAFTKELGVYSSERKKVATLTIRGNVTPRMKSTEELYPVDAGGGLRLSTTLNAFSYIRPGQQVQSAIGYANTSGKTIRLELRPLESSGLLTVTAPREIAPGEQGSINVAYLIPEADPRYARCATPSRCASTAAPTARRSSPTASASTGRQQAPKDKTPRKHR